MTDGTGCGGSNVCLAGACSPKKNNGDACGGNNECTSGQCVNGNCCNVACAGACQQCTTGTCQNKDNATSCGGSNICLAGVCGPKRSDGDSCAAPGECMSANCVSGICCNSACSGICKQCSTGTCGDKTNGVSCGSNLVCAAGACVAAPKANGDSCTAGGDCGSGFCSSDGKCCSESCSGSCRQCTGANWTCADKAEGLACTGGVCTAGVCAPKAGTGATCSVSNQCASGNCTGGHCCDMACSGSCQQCTAGTSWVCSPTNEGMDCSGNTNFCKMGACVPKKAPGDACGAGNECASGNCLASGFCCGSATCTDVCKECTAGTSWTCDKKSNGTTCNGSDVCQEGACKKDKGGSCGGDTDCAVGACVGGHCCTTACVGECKECTVTTGWACMPKTVGTVCGSGMMCTADGMCM